MATANRLTIDGSQGEGGGQILRTALGLSLATGRGVRIEKIRAGREKPGLMRQHLTAVQAAVAIGNGRATGAEIGSRTLEFDPGEVHGGEFQLAVGTAGSTTLVLQAILPALLSARTSSRIVLDGGTHNPFAPPFEFLARTFVPVLRQMGARITVSLGRHGFYPAGGGTVAVEIEPAPALAHVSILERGGVTVNARVLLSGLPRVIARRELSIVKHRLGLDRAINNVEEIDSAGPGNVLIVEIAASGITEILTGFGRKGVRAEEVAGEVCNEAEAYLAAGVPVGRHLADQLLVPMALAGGGTFRSLAPTPHTVTNANVIARFLPVEIDIQEESAATCRVHVRRVK